MMRVLFIASRIPIPAKDGGALATLQTLKLYHKAGFKVDVISFNTSKHYVEEEVVRQELPFINNLETVFLNTRLSIIGLLFNLFFSKKSYNLSRFHSHAFNLAIQKTLNTNDYERIHIEGLFATTFLYELKNIAVSQNIFLRTHNIEHEIWKKTATTHPNLLKRIYLSVMAERLRKEEMEICGRIKNFLHISPLDKYFFQKHFPQAQHTYIPYAVKVKPKSELRYLTENSVGFIGSMEWIPNKEGLKWFLSNVWPLVLKTNAKAHIHIAGKNLKAEDFIQFQNLSGLHICGEVEDAEEFVKSKSVFIVPLFAGSGVRIKTLEAMSMGVPVVSTSIGLHGIHAEHNRQVLIADKAQDFANSILALLDSETLRNQIIHSAISLLNSEYSEDSVIDKLKLASSN
jgi:glycosyltransferase involved in cell wall biosynthesis